MKRLFHVVTVMALSVIGSAVGQAADQASGGLGFRSNDIHARNASELRISAPIGVRYWLSGQKVGLDLGFGVSTHKDAAADKNTTDWSIEAGIPFRVKSWERVHVIARPGVNYASQEDYVPGSTPGSFEKITDKFTTFVGEIEAELFLVENVSVSASSGIGVVSYKPGESGAKTTTDFTTFGQNFTSVGFHVYLWGGK